MRELLNSLTIKEKIGQLAQLAPFLFISNLSVEITGYVRELHLDQKKIFTSGSVLGIGSAQEMIRVQKEYLSNSRHKIPLMFMADIIHGYKTIFPVPIALASSWNPDVAKLTARISAVEASTSGIHVTFSPMADIARDPRWGRIVEGFGEDPYLSGLFAASMVEGYQNDGIDKPGNLASCVKHFAGYGASEAGRDYNSVDLSKMQLFQFYLPAYKKALDAGARLVMSAFNTLDGIPCTTNSFLLRDVLRDNWKFKGVTISDYDSLQQTIAHGFASDRRDAAKKGILAGLDIEMASTTYQSFLEELIDSKEVNLGLLDEAVLRVLELKRDLGLFENPYKGADTKLETKIVLSEEHLEKSQDCANESIVLLKNNGVLPLNKNDKIAVIGPYANSRRTVGPWSWHGLRDFHETITEVLEEQVIFTSDASEQTELTVSDLAIIEKANVILLALGENDHQSGEAHSRSDISLPGNQASLVDMAKRLGKPCVVLLHNGRPLVLENILHADAILECWFLGSRHALAIKDILSGKVNPSGKLPITFPKSLGQVPIYYNHFNTGRPYLDRQDDNEYVSKYLDIDNSPRFPFGFGLSYSTFSLSNLKLSSKTMQSSKDILVSIDVLNEGPFAGFEVIQLYIRDYVGRIVRPVKELKAFQKVSLANKETKTVTFTITLADLSYILPSGETVYDKGEFCVMVGNSSINYLQANFYLN